MNDNFKLVCPCLLGIEGLAADELKRMGAQEVEPENGRVIFNGSYEMIARANINSRYSERVQILLGRFKAYSFEELFQAVKSIEWERWIGKNDKFPVKGRSLSSKLSSIPDCQSIIKKAVVERLKSKYKINWFEESGSLFQIQFLILKDTVSIMLDTSGSGLHKRGYRAVSGEAPIKETLACAMTDLSHVRRSSIVFDPFCGSGTILIEAALKAMSIAPGIKRTFIADTWDIIPKSVWKQERELARSKEVRDCDFFAYGYDTDKDCIELAKANAEKAGVGDKIKFALRDIRDFSETSEKGTVICNPPYGERLLNIQEAQRLYKIAGEKFVKKDNWSYSIISPDDDFEQFFGRKADKRRKLYNGMLKCQLYMYFK